LNGGPEIIFELIQFVFYGCSDNIEWNHAFTFESFIYISRFLRLANLKLHLH
jgi:hypothetical protein